jgi:hypothetical protein
LPLNLRKVKELSLSHLYLLLVFLSSPYNQKTTHRYPLFSIAASPAAVLTPRRSTGRAGPEFLEAQGETKIRGPLYIHVVDSTNYKYIYIFINT